MGKTKDADIRRFQPDFNWNGVERMPYKEDGAAPFRSISRQVLFDDPAQKCELRYFEMQAEGYSTLERHEHAHSVMILRGEGHCLIGDTVYPVKEFDLVRVPAWTWHQFRATRDMPLGFLCMVNAERDRPQLPNEAELAVMTEDPHLAAFLSGNPIAVESR